MAETLEKTTTQRIMDILENRYSHMYKGRQITETTLLDEEFGMDSVDRYEFTYFVEEELLVAIPDEIVWDLKNVRDYANYADAHREHK
ncbi:MAG TPA: acyl carrier protein [Patescibacteria group bacterium]|nr:acyl carrier protein [Patescibacteria group bacterium]